MMNLWRGLWRILKLIWHLADGGVRVICFQYKLGRYWHHSKSGKEMISRWMTRLGDILALQVDVVSPPLPVPAMIVANHVSWLDVVAIASVRPAQFVAKDTVRRWPVIGALAARGGTYFIRRNNIRALRDSNQHLCHSLRLRQHVAVFPEATTSAGESVGQFHSALFAAAQAAYCPIQPLAIYYHNNGERDPVAPYVGNELFVFHLWKILWRQKTCVELNFLPPISSRAHRRVLAGRSRDMIAHALAQGHRTPSPLPVLQPLEHCLSVAK